MATVHCRAPVRAAITFAQVAYRARADGDHPARLRGQRVQQVGHGGVVGVGGGGQVLFGEGVPRGPQGSRHCPAGGLPGVGVGDQQQVSGGGGRGEELRDGVDQSRPPSQASDRHPVDAAAGAALEGPVEPAGQ
ncbi:MAG: hypothetical protein Q9Q13_03265 [Acidobacteriota bacterium]|nr:hypothetical protein [Acidobacteriota bacterium]